jgi:hypothetical protein
MKNVIFWDVTLCGCCKSRRLEACCMLLLLVTANVVPSSPILVTLMMEAMRPSETSVRTRITQRNIQEDGILHSHARKKS